jgi:hypothetical protein
MIYDDINDLHIGSEVLNSEDSIYTGTIDLTNSADKLAIGTNTSEVSSNIELSADDIIIGNDKNSKTNIHGVLTVDDIIIEKDYNLKVIIIKLMKDVKKLRDELDYFKAKENFDAHIGGNIGVFEAMDAMTSIEN